MLYRSTPDCQVEDLYEDVAEDAVCSDDFDEFVLFQALGHLMVQYQQTGFAQPCIRQHKFLQYHDELAPEDGIILLLRCELLCSSSWKVVAEIVRYLVDGDDDAGEGDADEDHYPVIYLEFPP